jgi:hypothetical protein
LTHTHKNARLNKSEQNPLQQKKPKVACVGADVVDGYGQTLPRSGACGGGGGATVTVMVTDTVRACAFWFVLPCIMHV